VHNRTIGNPTVRADPSVRAAASLSIEKVELAAQRA